MPFRVTLILIACLATGTALAPVAVQAVTPAASTATIDQVGQVGLVRDVDGDGRISAGDAVYYEYRISAGGSALSNVYVVAPLLGAIICPRTALAAGTSMTCASHAPYVVSDADVAAGHFDVGAHAEGTDGGGASIASATTAVSTETGGPTDRTERTR